MRPVVTISRRRARHKAAAVAAGILADHLLGEPPAAVHPVALFGRVMRAVEPRLYADRRTAGALHAATGTGLGLAAGSTLTAATGPALATALATSVAVAGRALRDAALDVAAPLHAGDLGTARRRLPALVGRDPSALDAKEIARAVVESLAENTVDAVVAPACWALAAGPRGALAYRAVNTLDAMVGHHSERYERYGWASARLDDVANWLPARLTALLVCLVRPSRAGDVLRTVRSDGRAHPSPNAGVAEAAFAAALGLRLGGENRYGERVELRPHLGDGRPPEPADIPRAVDLSRDVGLALAALLALLARAGRR